MKLREIYNKENSPVISFEFFPPKDDDGQKTAALLNEISLLKKYNPGLVSVTYGAGGSTRHKSEELTKIINSKFELNVMPHFTCICSSRHDVDTRLETLTNAGIKNILAKHHGDDPVMIKLPAVDGYSTKIMTSSLFWVNSTNDLVNQMKQVFPDKVDIKIDSLDAPFELAQL